MKRGVFGCNVISNRMVLMKLMGLMSSADTLGTNCKNDPNRRRPREPDKGVNWRALETETSHVSHSSKDLVAYANSRLYPLPPQVHLRARVYCHCYFVQPLSSIGQVWSVFCENQTADCTVQHYLTSTGAIRLIRDGEPRTAISIFTQHLSSPQNSLIKTPYL